MVAATTTVVVVAVADAERTSNSFYIHKEGQDETPVLFFIRSLDSCPELEALPKISKDIRILSIGDAISEVTIRQANQ